MHFLRNAVDYVPRRVDDDCLQELLWFYERRDPAEVRRDLAAWLAKWQGKYVKLCAWDVVKMRLQMCGGRRLPLDLAPTPRAIMGDLPRPFRDDGR